MATRGMATRGMATKGMATVKQSITALYEESERSAIDGPPMLAVIESEPVAPQDLPQNLPPDLDMQAAMNDKPTIAARFDELRRLADLEMPSGRNDIAPPTAPQPRISETPTSAAPISDTPVADAPMPDSAVANVVVDETPDPIVAAVTDSPRFDPAADEILLPSEPPAPAAGNGASDLEVDDIRKLVQEAWEDETAIGLSAPDAPASPPADAPQDDPDIESAMEEIAAAVVQSGDPVASLDLEQIKTELVAAMRAELQAVVDSDLKVIVKAAVAEALKDMPAPKAAPRAKKATASKAAKKKATSVRPKDE